MSITRFVTQTMPVARLSVVLSVLSACLLVPTAHSAVQTRPGNAFDAAEFALQQSQHKPKLLPVGDTFDAAPFALPLDGDDASHALGLRWSEPRKIRQVVVDWGKGNAVPTDEVQVQYWKNHWDGQADPKKAGTGSAGWAEMDDWTNGEWKTAQAKVEKKGSVWTFTFEPTSTKEFEKIKDDKAAPYRKTLKIRLTTQQPLPKPKEIRALTEAVYQRLTVRVLFGQPADKRIHIEKTESGEWPNGYNGDSFIPVDSPTHWSCPAVGGEQEFYIQMAVDPNNPLYDRTVVTVPSKTRPFSFAADEVAKGDRILIDDLGILVVKVDDPITSIEEYRKQLRASNATAIAKSAISGRTLYEQIKDLPEQTLTKAWKDMPPRNPMHYIHGLPGDRNAMQQRFNGEIHVTKRDHWFKLQPSPRDTDRKEWTDDYLRVKFGLPDDEHSRGERSLLEGRLPILTSPWKKDSLTYEMTTAMDLLSRGDLTQVKLDDPTVLLCQIKVTNTSSSAEETAQLVFDCGGNKDEKLIIENEQAIGIEGGKRRVRFIVHGTEKGTLTPQETTVKWTMPLKPGESHTIYVFVPSITISTPEEIDALRKRDFDADIKRVADFWRNLNKNKGYTTIETPEPWLNDFYETHLRHMVINSQADLTKDYLYPHVGTFNYGEYTNESVMMISDMDRRGHHDMARRCLDGLLAHQGTVGLAGNFKSKDGILYGAGGHESGNYNKHHGYGMWAMAEHWWFTRDRQWMELAAPKLIKACDWVTSERQATMKTNPDGSKVSEYGWLPPGGLEDVQDYWHWQATNSATVWGFDAVAAALADFGHPEAGRLLRDAKAYHTDVVDGLNRAKIECPVVRLRDGTYVPKYPSRLYERGRAGGWIRETLEGSIFLPVMGLIDPRSIETDWILKDYEDNLYIPNGANVFGYTLKDEDFDRYWFSRGGFSMQANLLDGPIPYLQRDEIKHYLRAVFNGFASAFEPGVRMCNEHSLPELGNPAGDMFKTSDEAQVTCWLRLMFVHEVGDPHDQLILGQALPRYWFAQDKPFGIENAASYFGPLSFRVEPDVKNNTIKAKLTPPERNPPRIIYVRFRHPESKPIQSATVNGKPVDKINVEKEWVELPGNVKGPQEIVVKY
ncbi:MAG: hypothetical protein FWC56_00930 [Phycisphaerae bacterium]|nr:hypothetical protein [Phycisphaerae bacterium]